MQSHRDPMGSASRAFSPKAPQVSVIMPVRNARSTVEDAVRSILAQDFTDFELIAIDDGSTDGTNELLRALAGKDSRIRLLTMEPRGIIDALNIGIFESRGALLARMDADDICHRSRLRLQVLMMKNDPSLSVCGCLARFFPRKAVLGGWKRYEDWMNSLVTHEEIARDIFVESPMPHPGVMLRTEELREIGGYQERGWPEDYDLWLRYHICGRRFGKVPRLLIFQRVGPDRLTLTDSRYSVENFLRAKAHYLARLLGSNGRPVIIWGAGMTGRRLSKHLVREGVEIEAVIDIDPKKIGRTMRGRPIAAPEYLESSDSFVIAAVSSLGARGLIRERLRAFARVEGRDFICAA